MPNFWQLATTPILKFNNLLWVCWFLAKNLSNSLENSTTGIAIRWVSSWKIPLLCTRKMMKLMELCSMLWNFKWNQKNRTNLEKFVICIMLFNLVPSFITFEPMKSREIKLAERRPFTRLAMVVTGWTVNDAVFLCKFPWNHTLLS